jgi:hypothetical protein
VFERASAEVLKLHQFSVAATRAREQHKQKLIETVIKAADRDARHAEWLLKRQFPHEFAPYDRRPLPSEETPKQISVAFVCKSEKPLEDLLNFPMKGDVATPSEETKPSNTRRPVVGSAGV